MGYWKSRGLRGSDLEEYINRTNEAYMECCLGVVQKLPTSIKPVELDEKKGVIRLAYFEAKSTVDYMGNIQGIPICFDAKETSKKSLPIANIHEHQIAFMKAFEEQDGISFLIVSLKAYDEVYFLPFTVLEKYWEGAQNGTGRKSVPYNAFERQYQIRAKSNFMCHYLEALNIYLKNKGE
jgi:recombination protein U